MIKVLVSRKGDAIVSIQVTGHAYTADPGFDLVCAGVSSIMTGALNGFDQLDSESVILILDNEPLISIQCKTINLINQQLLKFVLIQLKTVEAAHSDAIEIFEKEEIQ